jgi:porphobilinogen synthase
VRETRLSTSDLICPLFTAGGGDRREPLSAIPGICVLSGSQLAREVRELVSLGIPAVLVFSIPRESEKDAAASAAWDPHGPAQEAVRLIKEAAPDLVVFTDLCLCEYTVNGHCGLLKDGEIDNDLTLECIRKVALAQARAGSDGVAPSGMMDGVVQTIRSALDGEGFGRVMTMPYSAKFASALYGPFKEATRSAPAESLHATHQLDVASGRQALSEIAQDVEEGADIVIVKPALSSLDILARARRRFAVPIAAYNVSGEYTMLLKAAGQDPAHRTRLMIEALTCIKRAGADLIITYFSREAAEVLGR